MVKLETEQKRLVDLLERTGELLEKTKRDPEEPLLVELEKTLIDLRALGSLREELDKKIRRALVDAGLALQERRKREGREEATAAALERAERAAGRMGKLEGLERRLKELERAPATWRGLRELERLDKDLDVLLEAHDRLHSRVQELARTYRKKLPTGGWRPEEASAPKAAATVGGGEK